MQEQFDQKENPLNSQEARPNFWQSLNKNQKIALIVLAVFVLFLMVAWSVQFKRSLTEPFAYKGDNTEDGLVDNGSNPANDLKNKDTDGDGLSDEDELNVYKTSPYLEDSDGDGIIDGNEIKNSTDPNCPEGKECASPETVVAAGATSTGAVPAISNLDIGVASTSNQDLQNLLRGETDANKLRKLLLDSGMDEKVLNQITDQELIDSYSNLQKN